MDAFGAGGVGGDGTRDLFPNPDPYSQSQSYSGDGNRRFSLQQRRFPGSISARLDLNNPKASHPLAASKATFRAHLLPPGHMAMGSGRVGYGPPPAPEVRDGSVAVGGDGGGGRGHGPVTGGRRQRVRGGGVLVVFACGGGSGAGRGGRGRGAALGGGPGRGRGSARGGGAARGGGLGRGRGFSDDDDEDNGDQDNAEDDNEVPDWTESWTDHDSEEEEGDEEDEEHWYNWSKPAKKTSRSPMVRVFKSIADDSFDVQQHAAADDATESGMDVYAAGVDANDGRRRRRFQCPATSPSIWSSSEWEKMRHQTVAVLNSLVPRTPELKDKLQFSCHLTRLSDMVTVGLPEFRRRRSYKDGRVSKLNVALLRKRLRSIHERNQSGLTRNTDSVCRPVDFEMEQASSLSACSSGISSPIFPPLGVLYSCQITLCYKQKLQRPIKEIMLCRLATLSYRAFVHPWHCTTSERRTLGCDPTSYISHTHVEEYWPSCQCDADLSYSTLMLPQTNGFCDTAHAYAGKGYRPVFDKWYMEEMVAKFQWNEAANYLSAFIPDRNCSKEASNLLDSMHCLKKNLKPSKVFEKSRCLAFVTE
ncbi:hypothetical protein EJB05_35941, partial [Eragrostis curvula]